MSHAADPVHDATEWVVACFAAERAISGSVKAASNATARLLGITPRRALSYWWRQVSFVAADEYLRIREGHQRRLVIQRKRAEAEMALCDALLAKIEALDAQTLHARTASLPHVAAEAHSPQAR